MKSLFFKLDDPLLFGIGGLIIGLWCILLTRDLFQIPQLGAPILITLLVFSVVVHFLTVKPGSRIAAWAGSSYLALLAVTAVSTFDEALQPPLAVLASISVIGHNETIRLSFARRRGAVISPGIYLSSGLSLLAVAVVSIIALQVARQGLRLQPLDNLGQPDQERNWWLPISVACISAAVMAVLFIPALKKNPRSVPKYRPGQRIEPNAIPASDTANVKP